MKRKLSLTSIALAIGLTMSGLSYAETSPAEPKQQTTSNQLMDQVNADLDAMYAFIEIEAQAKLKKEGKPADYTEALAKLTSAAERNSSVAQYMLGEAYADGEEQSGLPIEQDAKKALYWLKKSAELNYNEAQLKLGKMYLKGDVIPVNYKLSFSWTKKAAFNNNPRAQATVGFFYENGFGTTKNLVEAYAWYSVSAANITEPDGVTLKGENLRELTAELRDKLADVLYNSGKLDKAQELAQTYLDQITENTKL